MEVQDWYVVRTKPRKELQVYKALTSKSINTYYPTIEVKPINPRAAKIRPYFPGYLFVQADLDVVNIKDLRWLPGILGLVEFGDHIATISDQIISELKRKVDKIAANGGLSAFNKGDLVRITVGPLAGYEALFDTSLSGKERVIVLLQLLGRSTKVEADLSSIEKLK